MAQRAKVSVATVSRVLNGSEKVVPETRTRIQAVIDEMGYMRNSAARTLNSGRTMTVGAIVPTLDHAIFAKFLHALESRFSAQGYSLMISSSEWDADTEVNKAQAMVDMGAEALVVSGAEHSDDFISLVRRYDVPTILTSFFDPNADLPTIGYDNAKVARMAIGYLAGLGHREIAVLHGPKLNNDRTTARLEGLLSFGGDLNLDLVETTLDVQGGRLGATAAFSNNPSITAILGLSDLLAIGALFEAQDRGVIVPSELSIMGFDNLELGTATSPPLSTIRLGVAKMAQRTADAICAHLANGNSLLAEEMNCDVIERNSVQKIFNTPS
ncbi:MAG: LacI family DNA-binding transcriptional regulator [Hyphomicrobiales bacterium]